MLSGTASLDELAGSAPTMQSLDPDPVRFEHAEVLQAAFEMPYAARTPNLPAGLHPTTPPLLVVLAWKVDDGPWGPFAMVQVRVSCRSGVRPRGFVAGCRASTPEAADALRSQWGIPAQVGDVALERFYDSVALDAGPTINLTGLDPDPLDPGDVQYTVTTTLARTPRGPRLVQVEPEYELRRVERLRPRLDGFDPAAWGRPHLEPKYPVSATIGVGALSLPRLRFVSRPDVVAFEGTETTKEPSTIKEGS